VRRRRLLVVGDSFLDRDVEAVAERVCPDAPALVLEETAVHSRPGGAGLAAALSSSGPGEVTLVTALGDDEAAAVLRAELEAAGVGLVDLGLGGTTPQKIRLMADGRSVLRLDRGQKGSAPRIMEQARDVLASHFAGADALLVSDYGRGVARHDTVRSLVSSFEGPTVWDPHPKGPVPVPGVTVATPNVDELANLFPHDKCDMRAMSEAARSACCSWRATNVAVTLGRRGAMLVSDGGLPLVVPVEPLAATDPCGAGDRFASSFAWALADGDLPSEALAKAVSDSTRFVASGGANQFSKARGDLDKKCESTGSDRQGPQSQAMDIARAVAVASAARSAGRRVVVAGGCFDILHAGHVQLLNAAKALGDLLIVCINSDRSVQRVKGPDRPLVPEADRAVTLNGLGSVDAVVVFDEDTPVSVLEKLRPHVFVKGGDYATMQIPEELALAAWGGQVVVMPYLSGRSTTDLIERAARWRLIESAARGRQTV
jgi:D-beta-D-heptose 7-phosphate kinase/D-beta-D-heptose 1-phosphate adenosyltransferase